MSGFTEVNLSQLDIAVIGAGAIGRAHAHLLMQSQTGARLCAVVDPAPQIEAFAASLDAPWFADVEGLLRQRRPDGAIVATPNETHAPVALALLDRAIPLLVEKPIAPSLAQAQEICEAARRSGAPVLVGHQRRYNPVTETARALVAQGRLGRLVSVTGLAVFRKPDDYFEASWRRQPETGGPILINLIHEIDLVRHVCGEIVSVQALAGHVGRGFDVEDTAAALLRLDNGALVTLSLCDAAPSPWSWDICARESAAYPPLPARVASHYLCGTEASLTLPHLEMWRCAGPQGWREPLVVQAAPFTPADPYAAQFAHFARVIRAEEAPRITAQDATATLRATPALRDSARTGGAVSLS